MIQGMYETELFDRGKAGVRTKRTGYVLLLTLLAAAPVKAAGFGNVGVDQTTVTDTSVTLSWSRPSGKFAYCGAPASDQHLVCWRKSSQWTKNPCNVNQTPVDLASSSHLVSGLTTGTRYKFEVHARATKKGKKCKYRQVGKVHQVVVAPPTVPEIRVGHVEVTDFDDVSMDVDVSWSHPVDHDLVRSCYRERFIDNGSTYSLKNLCERRDAWISPANNIPTLGYGEFASSPNVVNSFAFDDLLQCTRYVIEGTRFAPSAGTGVRIGRIHQNTTGFCKTYNSLSSFVGESVSTDTSDAVAVDYLASVGGLVPRPANIVADANLEPGVPLFSFFRTSADPWRAGEWNVEAAAIIDGTDTTTGIRPLAGDGMLRVDATGGSASQINQIIGPVTELIAASGTTTVNASLYLNAATATQATLRLRSGDGQSSVGSLTGATETSVVFSTDGDPESWELVTVLHDAPASTVFLELQLSALNSEIPADGLFVDFSSSFVDVAANRVFDPGFEPTTPLFAFFRVAGNPWIPGEWNAENSIVVDGTDPAAGVSPASGESMLRIDQTAGAFTQTNQIIELYEPVSPLGDTEGTWRALVNAASSTTVRLYQRTGSGQNSNGTLTDLSSQFVDFVTDADPATWEVVEASRLLPANTQFLELQLAVDNTLIPATGVFVDEVSVRVEQDDLIWDLAQLDSSILSAAELQAYTDDSLQDDTAVLDYLVNVKPSLFASWQGELSTIDPGLVIDTWLNAEHPTLYDDLLEEFEDQFADVPSMSPVAIVSLIAGLAVLGKWSLRRRAESSN